MWRNEWISIHWTVKCMDIMIQLHGIVFARLEFTLTTISFRWSSYSEGRIPWPCGIDARLIRKSVNRWLIAGFAVEESLSIELLKGAISTLSGFWDPFLYSKPAVSIQNPSRQESTLPMTEHWDNLAPSEEGRRKRISISTYYGSKLYLIFPTIPENRILFSGRRLWMRS